MLNKIKVKKEYPIPIIDDAIAELKVVQVFSTLDLKSGYHQLHVRAEYRHRAAFYAKMAYLNGKG